MTEETKIKLDELVKNLDETFNDDSKFYADEEYPDGDLYTCDTELDFEIDDLLITGGGQCNWENMRYVCDHGYRIYAGEKDSFGWLTGVIAKKGQTGRFKKIIYG